MIVRIVFEYKPDYLPLCYWASAMDLVACGSSFNEAKQRLIEKLKVVHNINETREPEMVDI